MLESRSHQSQHFYLGKYNNDISPHPMSSYDVFNGDADGICALHQLRLARPGDSTLISGVKRDIALLEQVDARPGDQVTVLDISLDKNRSALEELLVRGVKLQYFDHHFSGTIPQHANLEARIDTAPDVCTSLIVNRYLDGQYLAWAVVAAYGDNLFESARLAAATLQLKEGQLDLLKELGTYINYNGYGNKLEDLFFDPKELYRRIRPYPNPFDFIHTAKEFSLLRAGYREDMANASALKVASEHAGFAVFILPESAWANRVSGVFANLLARQQPNRAHVILTSQGNDGYVVSVRAALAHMTGADEVCRQFETGGGRKAAAGINRLPHSDYDRLITVLSNVFKACD